MHWELEKKEIIKITKKYPFRLNYNVENIKLSHYLFISLISYNMLCIFTIAKNQECGSIYYGFINM